MRNKGGASTHLDRSKPQIIIPPEKTTTLLLVVSNNKIKKHLINLISRYLSSANSQPENASNRRGITHPGSQQKFPVFSDAFPLVWTYEELAIKFFQNFNPKIYPLTVSRLWWDISISSRYWKDLKEYIKSLPEPFLMGRSEEDIFFSLMSDVSKATDMATNFLADAILTRTAFSRETSSQKKSRERPEIMETSTQEPKNSTKDDHEKFGEKQLTRIFSETLENYIEEFIKPMVEFAEKFAKKFAEKFAGGFEEESAKNFPNNLADSSKRRESPKNEMDGIANHEKSAKRSCEEEVVSEVPSKRDYKSLMYFLLGTLLNEDQPAKARAGCESAFGRFQKDIGIKNVLFFHSSVIDPLTEKFLKALENCVITANSSLSNYAGQNTQIPEGLSRTAQMNQTEANFSEANEKFTNSRVYETSDFEVLRRGKEDAFWNKISRIEIPDEKVQLRGFVLPVDEAFWIAEDVLSVISENKVPLIIVESPEFENSLKMALNYFGIPCEDSGRLLLSEEYQFLRSVVEFVFTRDPARLHDVFWYAVNHGSAKLREDLNLERESATLYRNSVATVLKGLPVYDLGILSENALYCITSRNEENFESFKKLKTIFQDALKKKETVLKLPGSAGETRLTEELQSLYRIISGLKTIAEKLENIFRKNTNDPTGFLKDLIDEFMNQEANPVAKAIIASLNSAKDIDYLKQEELNHKKLVGILDLLSRKMVNFANREGDSVIVSSPQEAGELIHALKELGIHDMIGKIYIAGQSSQVETPKTTVAPPEVEERYGIPSPQDFLSASLLTKLKIIENSEVPVIVSWHHMNSEVSPKEVGPANFVRFLAYRTNSPEVLERLKIYDFAGKKGQNISDRLLKRAEKEKGFLWFSAEEEATPEEAIQKIYFLRELAHKKIEDLNPSKIWYVTQIESFFVCPRRFLFDLIARNQHLIKSSSVPMLEGTVIHHIIEIASRETSFKDSKEEEGIREGLKKALQKFEEEVGSSKYLKELARHQVEPLIKNFSATEARWRNEPLTVCTCKEDSQYSFKRIEEPESRVELEINGHKIVGRIDRIDLYTNKKGEARFIIWDYKHSLPKKNDLSFSSQKEKPEKLIKINRIQILLYQYLLNKKYSERIYEGGGYISTKSFSRKLLKKSEVFGASGKVRGLPITSDEFSEMLLDFFLSAVKNMRVSDLMHFKEKKKLEPAMLETTYCPYRHLCMLSDFFFPGREFKITFDEKSGTLEMPVVV